MGLLTAERRDALMLSAAIVLGLIVPPGLSVLGLPIAAAGVAGLAYRNRFASAAIAAVLGVAAAMLLSFLEAVQTATPADKLDPTLMVIAAAAYTAPAIIAVICAAMMASRIDIQWAGLMLAAVLGTASGVYEYFVMRAQDITSGELIADTVKLIAVPGSTSQQNADTVKLLVTLVPTVYFVSGLITAVVVIAAIRWAGRRSDRALRIPMLGVLDLTPHVLWPFIGGAFSLAASYAPGAYASTLQAVGLNLVFSASFVFAVQGAGVVAGMLDRFEANRGTRVLAWSGFVLVNFAIPVASLVGLLDFWVNFRRLPRDGAAPPPPAAMSDS
jgi:hypothetical protein